MVGPLRSRPSAGHSLGTDPLVRYRRVLALPLFWLAWLFMTPALILRAAGKPWANWALFSLLLAGVAVVHVLKPLRSIAVRPEGLRGLVRVHRWSDIDRVELVGSTKGATLRLHKRGKRHSAAQISQRLVVGSLEALAEDAKAVHGVDFDDHRDRAGRWKRAVAVVGCSAAALTVLGFSQLLVVPGLRMERPGTVVDAHERLRHGPPTTARGKILILSVTRRPALLRDLFVDRQTTRFWWENPFHLASGDKADLADEASAQHAAVTAGTTCVGRTISMSNDGVEVDVGVTGPAAAQVSPHERILSVGGRPVASKEDVYDALVDWNLAFPVAVEVEGRDGQTRTETLKVIRLADGPSILAGVGIRRRAITLPDDAPSFDLSRLQGDSDGLALAMTIVDVESPVALVAPGTRVAMTGSIGPDGLVGPIGSVDEKVAAAERAGASVVLVPATQADEARRAGEGSGMRIVGVRTLDEAVIALGGSGCLPA